MKILNSRSGISTIIGGFIFMILMAGAFTAFIAAVQLQNNLMASQVKVSATEIGKIKEKFTASPDVENNILTLNVANTGSVDLEIDNLWFVNKSQTGEPYLLHDIKFDDGLVPIGKAVNILSGENAGIKDGTYNLKIVSSRGNIQTIEDFIVDNGGLGGTDCEVKAYVVPPNIAVAGNATLIMQVFNRGTNTIFDLEPGSGATSILITDPNGGPTVMPLSAVIYKKLTSPSSINELRGGESFLFAWNYKLTGAVGSIVEFDVTAHGKTTDDGPFFDVPCDTSETITKLVEGIKDEVLHSELSVKPSMFLIYPNPSGESEKKESRGFWGVVIVNPTNQTMTVDRVVIQAISISGMADEQIFKKNEADFDFIFPRENDVSSGATQGSWGFPENNLASWTATAGSPISVPAKTAQQFVMRTESEAKNDDIEAYNIAAVAFTSFGHFTNIGHASSSLRAEAGMDVDSVIVNIYPTTKDVTGTTAKANISTDANDLNFDATLEAQASTTQQFYFTIREGQIDMEDMGMHPDYLAAGSTKIIINLPVGFPNVTPVTPNSNFQDIEVVTFANGEQQIVATIANNLGDTNETAERFTLSFTIDTPNVDEDRIYVIYSFTSGRNIADIPVGAVSEGTVVKVTP